MSGLIHRDRRIFITCYFASGAAALVYQVAWTRLLLLQLGHTTAASSTVLAAFMGGMAAGAWVGGQRTLRFRPATSHVVCGYRAVHRCRRGRSARCAARPRTGSRVGIRGRNRSDLLRDGACRGQPFPGRGSGRSNGSDLPNCSGVARGIGAHAPGIASALATAAGALYAANTAGAAIGAISAGFWLIPAVGLRATTWIGIALNIAAAAGAFWFGRPRHRLQRGKPRIRVTLRRGKAASRSRDGEPAAFAYPLRRAHCSRPRPPASPDFSLSCMRSHGPDCLRWCSDPRPTRLPSWPHPSLPASR